jgi:hypothetical protein
MHSTRIVAYTFRADTYAPSAILAALPTGDGEDYDGWGYPESAMPRTNAAVEESLNELALAFGINRSDEYTFDSDTFPKVVFAHQVDDWETESLIDSSGEYVTFAEYYG